MGEEERLLLEQAQTSSSSSGEVADKKTKDGKVLGLAQISASLDSTASEDAQIGSIDAAGQSTAQEEELEEKKVTNSFA